MYLHQTSGLKLHSSKIRSSRSPIKIIVFGEAILVPIAVPLSCLKKDKFCSNILFFNRIQLNSLGSLQILSCLPWILKIVITLLSLQHAGYLDIKPQHYLQLRSVTSSNLTIVIINCNVTMILIILRIPFILLFTINIFNCPWIIS